MTPPARRRTLKKVVVVSTSDRGSGAEVVAWSLFKGFERHGLQSWMLVGDKKSDDPRVLPFYLSPHLNYERYRMAWRQCWQRMLKHTWRRLGIDDFVFPYTRAIMRNTGSPPDAVVCTNLHGGYFDLRGLAPLSKRVPVFLTLQDMWLFTGHCAYSLECGRWETGCGRCPDLARPLPVERDATRFNWWRKARLHRQGQYFVAAPSRWILDRAERSMLKPAIMESRVIPNGFDPAIFHPAPKLEARAKLAVSQEGHLLVFAAYNAVSNPHKDYATLRAAAELLSREDLAGPVHIAVIGQAAEVVRLGNVTIHHLPFTDQTTLAHWYQAADLYLHPVVEEVFGLVVIEALACGTPVVASNTGGIPEIVRQELDGLLVPPKEPEAFASAIAFLLKNRERRLSMGSGGANHVRIEFNQEKMIATHLDWMTGIGSRWKAGA